MPAFRRTSGPKGRSPIIQAAVPEELKDVIADALEVVGQHVDGKPWSMSGFLREAIIAYLEGPTVKAAYVASDRSPPLGRPIR